MENPIKENRIVSDKTYAVRNLAMLSSLNLGQIHATPWSLEEYTYLCTVACRLLQYQVETCPDDERWYFENLHKGYKDWKDILEFHICKNNGDFLGFLKESKIV